MCVNASVCGLTFGFVYRNEDLFSPICSPQALSRQLGSNLEHGKQCLRQKSAVVEAERS